MPKLKRLYTPWLLSLTLLVSATCLAFGGPSGISFAPSPVCPPSDGSSSPSSPVCPPTDRYPWTAPLSQDTVKIPQGLIITRNGQLPPPALERSFLLSELAKDTVKEVFQAPPCLEGNYYLAFQLYYDLGDRQTQPDWSAQLDISLLFHTDSLWVKPVALSMTHQTFIATLFHDSLVSCNDNYRFLIKDKVLTGVPPQDNIYLKVLLYKDARDVFDPAEPLLLHYSSFNGQTTASWSHSGKAVQGYDVEWVHIADHENFTGSTAQQAFQWKEPARVTTSDQLYTQLTYFPSGRIWYRARAVGYDRNHPGHRINGNWFYGPGTAITITNHQPNLTWQEQTVFTEAGKYKKVMYYLDGTLRQRQMQTNLSTQGQTLVGETQYDYEGRSAVELLPTPVDAVSLAYKPDFNVFAASEALVTSHTSAIRNKFHYDNYKLENSIVSSSSGAGKYYSPANDLFDVHWEALPDSEGHVYSQSEYTQDGTGRVRKQSGVGKAFRLDGSHAVRYYYAEAAPAELVRLFGSNVGNALHYKKNMVVDANAQVSVSYVDQQDRTIATALAGDPPANLDSLQSFKDLDLTPVTVDVSHKNRTVDGKSLLQHKLLNASPNTTFTFAYDLSALGADMQSFGCSECTFDLKIALIDPDGFAVDLSTVPGNQSPAPDQYEVLGISAADCAVARDLNVTFDVVLSDIGDYTVIKTLTPRDVSFEDMLLVVEQDSSVRHLVQAVRDSYPLDSASCEICVDTCPEADGLIEEAIREIADLDCENLYLQIEQHYRDLYGAAGDEFYEVPLDSMLSHPDYCQYELCAKNKESDVFEKQIARARDWNAALAAGYNDLIHLDPFFNDTNLSGSGYKGSMQSKLNDMLLASVPYDNNGDGVQDGTTDYRGTLSEVTDPNNTSFYINASGLSDPHGRHILYLDLMGRQAQMTAQEYQAELDLQRWILYRNFYLEAKRKTKQEIPEYQNCRKAMDDLNLVDELPQTEAEIATWSETNGATAAVSTEEVAMAVTNISAICAADFSPADSTAIGHHLEAYFNKDRFNLLRLIIKNDLGSDPDLIAVQNILNHYHCGLDSIALDDIRVCAQDTTITISDSIAAPMQQAAGGQSALTASPTEIKRDTKNIQALKKQRDERLARIAAEKEEIYAKLTGSGNASQTGNLVMDPGLITRPMSSPPLPTQSEYAALLAFYNATNNFNSWFNDSGWSTANPSVVEDVSTWYGVVLDANGHVIELNLNSNGLSGEIPAAIGDLIHLRVLDLGFVVGRANNLSGTLPASMSNMTQLEVLDISRNQLSGPFPNVLCSLPSLRVLNLEGRWSGKFSGSIPSCIANLLNLEELNLSVNLFTGPFPAVTNMSDLRVLDLSVNDFTGPIAANIGNLGMLTFLDLSFTDFSGDVPASLWTLNNLAYLYLYKSGWGVSGPKLSGQISSTIGGMTKLRYVVLSENNFSGPIPSEIGNLLDLHALNLGNNNFTGPIPTQIGNLQDLHFLTLSDNSLSGAIPSQIGNLDSLRSLQLSDNQLTGSIPTSLGALTVLRELALDNNQLTGSIPSTLGDLTDLEELYLQHNQLTGDLPATLGNLTWLYDFHIQNNQLSGKIPAALYTLNTLYIENNKFTFSDFLEVYLTGDLGYGCEEEEILRAPPSGNKNILPTNNYFFAVCFSYSPQDSVDVQKSFSVIQGASHTLVADVDRHSDPASAYQWFKYVAGGVDIPLTASPDTAGHSYTLPSITAADAGYYYYKITNSSASDLTLTSRLQQIEVNGIRDITVCLSYDTDTLTNPTLAKFSFAVDWNSEVQRCLDHAAREDSVLMAFALEKLLQEQVSDYYNAYRTQCLNGISDGLQYTFLSQEYHYTLYYFDQGGNLAQTVPPEGVQPLTLVQTTAMLAGTPTEPVHTLITRYRYNSLDQLIWQSTPDAGESQFWYDDKGQLRLSQDAQQLIDSTYSYTRYDEQGRIIEVGELYTMADLLVLLDSLASPTFPKAPDYTLADITKTYYDFAREGLEGFTQENLRTRVSYIQVIDKDLPDTTATYYSYDIHGNVKSLRQQLPGLAPKRTDYVYDLISGNVNYVMYQYGEADQFIHRYDYDPDNRLLDVFTSTDGYLWSREANYQYYSHGPLARMELGEYRVQGVDYFYTLQGWLKGINKPLADDLGTDNPYDFGVGKDVYAFTLGYYDGDYRHIETGAPLPDTHYQMWPRHTEVNSHNGLYNGNISWMVTDLAKMGEEKSNRTQGMQAMLYQYDQLNRITRARSLTNYGLGSGFATRSTGPEPYDVDYSYDANGNLLTLQRHDAAGALANDFQYSYYAGTNRLRETGPFLEDIVYDGGRVLSNSKVYRRITVRGNSYVPQGEPVELRATEGVFMEPQFRAAAGRNFRARIVRDEDMYQYDAIGNLILDQAEGTKITWTPYGKVRTVSAQSDTVVTTFRYDGAGNRIEKRVVTNDTLVAITRYLRDASGNVMAIYQDSTLQEQPVYGSSRLGQYQGGAGTACLTLGTRRYELSNHLGNVLTVITDNIGMSADTTWATVVSASDYYPFGLTMEGRNYQDSLYRYGFNGKEKDDKGEWGSTNYDYGERVYSPSIGRWLSIDPLQHRYPDTSPYAFVRNSPIAKIDVKGLWDIIVHFYKGRKRGKEGALILVNNSGEVVGIWKAGGRGSKSVQNLFPNDLAARRRTKNGDTPLGRWKISHWQKSRDSNEEKDYGFYRLWLTDFEGEEVDRDANTIRVHGAIAEKSYGSNGRNTEDGSLWNTKGCIRMSLIDAMDLYINTVNLEMEDPNESPGVLTTENALSDRNVDAIFALKVINAIDDKIKFLENKEGQNWLFWRKNRNAEDAQDIGSFKKLRKEYQDIIFENSYDDVNFDPEDYEGNV